MYRRGTAPVGERGLCLEAVIGACEQAGIDPRDVDGVVSYGSDRNAGPRLMPGLGMRELRWSSMVWEGGGGGIAGALGMAASAIVAGQAEIVAFVRGLAERDGGRLRDDVSRGHISLQYAVNGVRVAGADLRPANPADAGRGGPGVDALRRRRRVVPPRQDQPPRVRPQRRVRRRRLRQLAVGVRAAAPLRLLAGERRGVRADRDLGRARAPQHADRPAYVLSAPHGIGAAFGGEVEESGEPYWSAGFESVARRLWAESGYGPADVDVVQVYENFTGPAVASIIDHGFCTLQTAGEFITYENLIVEGGKLPTNTAGGNLAEGFIHGMAGAAEAARQILGGSPNPVAGASLSLLAGGPGAPLVSSALLGSAETL